MKLTRLSIDKLFRKGSNSQTKRISIDFILDGESLLEILSKASKGHSDYMGCFVRGFEEYNTQNFDAFTCKTDSNLEDARALFYICPECGDIACGAYSAKIKKTNNQYVWQDFAYINGYEEAEPIEDIGPYYFDKDDYKNIMNEIKDI